MKERVPKKSYKSESRQGRDEDALILSDELDVNVASEFPEFKVGDGNVQGEKRRRLLNTNWERLEKQRTLFSST